jgi:NADPH-dependent curcumin reductase CurA
MTASIRSRRVILAARPQGAPKLTDFKLEDAAVQEPGTDELLVETRWLSLDPYMRGRMDDRKSYSAPVPLGGIMEGQ